jgi:poly-gamma-glutamate synthesis protein (capsule biosynthesis protein)
VVSRILSDARAARKAGSDLTVVSLHWGSEYQHAATEGQRWVADRLTASGLVDLVVGHHAHVVQPIGRSNGVPVVYGMGNQLSGQRASYLGTPSVEDGVVVWAVAELVHGRYRVTQVSVTPTWVAPGTYRILPAQATATERTTPTWLASALRASFARTMRQILALAGRSWGVRAIQVPPLGAEF